MIGINLCIVMVLLAVMYTDFTKRLIYDRYIIALIFLGAVRNTMQGGLKQVVLNGCCLIVMYLVCILIGFFYQKTQHIDIAGGGDYKLISVFAFLFGLHDLLFCLVFELTYEIIYRYILFPQRKREALPLGASFSIFGILLLLI